MILASIDDQNFKQHEILTKLQEISGNNEVLITELESISNSLAQLTEEYNNQLLKNQLDLDNYNQLLNSYNKLEAQCQHYNEALISERESFSNKFAQLTEEYNNQLLKNQLDMENYNQLFNSYNKLEIRYQKYKNTFFKTLARKIKSLYNKKTY